MKDIDDLKKIIALAVAFLAMFLVIGASMHAMNQIKETNQRRNEKKQGEEFAATIAATTEATNIWDYMRSTTSPPAETAAGESGAAQEGADSVQPETQGNTNTQTVTTTVPSDIVIPIS